MSASMTNHTVNSPKVLLTLTQCMHSKLEYAKTIIIIVQGASKNQPHPGYKHTLRRPIQNLIPLTISRGRGRVCKQPRNIIPPPSVIKVQIIARVHSKRPDMELNLI